MSPEELDLPESLRDPEEVLSDTGAAGRLKQAIAGMSQENRLRILLYASDAENEKLRGLHAMVGECEEAAK